MKNLRTYGKAPFHIAVIHGGPGAAGEMAPVAHELALDWHVLEPLQTATSLGGQVEELKAVLERNGDLPITLIGFSWGAWLSFILTANYPAIVKKLVLISSGPYEERYATGIMETRLSRLSREGRAEARSLIEILDKPAAKDRNRAFARLGALLSQADTYDPIMDAVSDSEVINYRVDIFQSVWRDAAELRRSGRLLSLGKRIRCPVMAIHGDYDPHPAEGVRKPLSATLKSFQHILLKNCGHRPWIERQAKDRFYDILKQELRD
jgi:pimeloyl-ACP methyl ester carboxylesterase